MAGNRGLAILMVVATIAFAIGISAESSDSHAETASEAPAAEGAPVEGSPSAEAAELGTDTGAHVETGAEQSSESESETLLGVDLESTPFVVAAVALSLALALAVALRPQIVGLLLIVALAMLGFAALDVREVVHQLDESREGIAVLAAAIAVLHGAAALLAGRLGRSRGNILRPS